MNDPVVTTEPVADPRPPCPPMPTLYVVRWMEWNVRWCAYSSTYITKAPAEAQATYLIAHGGQQVEIVTIRGAEV